MSPDSRASPDIRCQENLRGKRHFLLFFFKHFGTTDLNLLFLFGHLNLPMRFSVHVCKLTSIMFLIICFVRPCSEDASSSKSSAKSKWLILNLATITSTLTRLWLST